MQKSGYDVFANEFTMFTVDGDIRDEPANRDSEIVGHDFATREEASAAAHEWARENPATWNRTVDAFNPLTLTHHMIEVCPWTYDADDDEYEYGEPVAQLDTTPNGAHDRLCKIQDSWDDLYEEL